MATVPTFGGVDDANNVPMASSGGGAGGSNNRDGGADTNNGATTTTTTTATATTMTTTPIAMQDRTAHHRMMVGGRGSEEWVDGTVFFCCLFFVRHSYVKYTVVHTVVFLSLTVVLAVDQTQVCKSMCVFVWPCNVYIGYRVSAIRFCPTAGGVCPWYLLLLFPFVLCTLKMSQGVRNLFLFQKTDFLVQIFKGYLGTVKFC